MNFYEFCEGIARVAEKISIIIPLGLDGSNVVDHVSRRELPLDEKLDGLILYLYFRLGDQIKREFIA